jgi:anti-sigma B factor antagonist
MPVPDGSPGPTVAPSGDLDLTNARELAARLSELAGASGDAILDLSGVRFIDSTGLGVVLKGATRFHRQDKRLVLVVPEDSAVARVIELSGMRDRLAIVPTREDAFERATADR